MIMDGVVIQDASPFVMQQHGHKDMVEAVDFNAYGSRMALGSADGKIKVYDKTRDGTWTLCDTWGAHSAEVLEVSPGPMVRSSIAVVEDTDKPGRSTGSPLQSTPISSRP